MNYLKKKGNLITVILVIALAVTTSMVLISCGNDNGENNAVSKNEFAVETKENKESDSFKKDDSEVALDKNADKSDEKQSFSNKTQKETQKSTQKTAQKETQKSTQAATQTKKVCYISIEGFCSNKEISLQGGDTAYSILCRSGASVSGSSSYVKGINGRFEFDEGPTSGWVYYVNGSRPSVGCGSYSIKSGDYVKWDYVTGL